MEIPQNRSRLGVHSGSPVADTNPSPRRSHRESFGSSPGFRGAGQLYQTESGKVAFCTVGLPARGKTHMAVSLKRYLDWLGVRTEVFHLGDYRREALEDKNTGKASPIPPDYYRREVTKETASLRKMVFDNCLRDIMAHFRLGGQVAIYDAVNPTSEGRRQLAQRFTQLGVATFFIESVCTDENLIARNVRSVKLNHPDYVGWNPDEAVRDYIERMNDMFDSVEPVAEPELGWVKVFNVSERIETHNFTGYLQSRIVFHLMNLHTEPRTVYFARAGNMAHEYSYKQDNPLDEMGKMYARNLASRFDSYLRGKQHQNKHGCVIWCSTRRRTIETARAIEEKGWTLRQRPQLAQLNPGIVENLKPEEIEEMYPDEFRMHQEDPWLYRYPRGESYHDVAVRLEPVITELERERSDLLIIAHETILRVLYAYLQSTPSTEIPRLQFPRDRIIELNPHAYGWQERSIPIPGVELAVDEE